MSLLNKKAPPFLSLHSHHHSSTYIATASQLFIYYPPPLPGTFCHGAWPPDSLWPSGSGRARFHQRASPDSGPQHLGSWAWLWVLHQNVGVGGEEGREVRKPPVSIVLGHT